MNAHLQQPIAAYMPRVQTMRAAFPVHAKKHLLAMEKHAQVSAYKENLPNFLHNHVVKGTDAKVHRL